MDSLRSALLLSATVLIAVGFIQFAYGVEIPDKTRSLIESWVSEAEGSDEMLARALSDMKNEGFIKSRFDAENIYQQPGYGQTSFVKISGRTGDYRQTSPVSLTVISPDGSESDYTSPVLESGAFQTVIPITGGSPMGTYKIIVHHAGNRLPDIFFHVGYPGVVVPEWFDGVAKWWLDGLITDDDFVAGIDFLIEADIIQIAGQSTVKTGLNVEVSGQAAVRRGTAQEISVRVSNDEGAVEGATVFVRVEDYDEELFEEFRGSTDSSGVYEISWEISTDFENLKEFLVYVDVTDGLSSTSKLFTFEVYCLCGEQNCKCRT